MLSGLRHAKAFRNNSLRFAGMAVIEEAHELIDLNAQNFITSFMQSCWKEEELLKCLLFVWLHQNSRMNLNLSQSQVWLRYFKYNYFLVTFEKASSRSRVEQVFKTTCKKLDFFVHKCWLKDWQMMWWIMLTWASVVLSRETVPEYILNSSSFCQGSSFSLSVHQQESSVSISRFLLSVLCYS